MDLSFIGCPVGKINLPLTSLSFALSSLHPPKNIYN